MPGSYIVIPTTKGTAYILREPKHLLMH